MKLSREVDAALSSTRLDLAYFEIADELSPLKHQQGYQRHGNPFDAEIFGLVLEDRTGRWAVSAKDSGKGLTAIINAVVHGPPWPQDEALRDIRVG